MSAKKDSLVSSIGTVTILTDDLVIFQGLIRKQDDDKRPSCEDGKHSSPNINIEIEEDKEFILLTLECVPVVVNLTGAALHFVLLPIYQVGNTIRINVDEIIAIGPNSIGCITATPG